MVSLLVRLLPRILVCNFAHEMKNFLIFFFWQVDVCGQRTKELPSLGFQLGVFAASQAAARDGRESWW
jgi:hypothetical protein